MVRVETLGYSRVSLRDQPLAARRADQGAGAGPRGLRCLVNSSWICACSRRRSAVRSRQYPASCFRDSGRRLFDRPLGDT
jgi:hypothetical protein